MANSLFEELERSVARDDVDDALAKVAKDVQQRGRFHELFEIRKMQLRRKLGLPPLSSSTLGDEDGNREQQEQLERGLLDACQEIGNLLLSDGRIRDAWMYLRAVGDRSGVADRLAQLAPEGEQVDEMIEVALGESVAPALGFRLALEHYGTCNSITALTGHYPSLSLEARQSTAELLVRHIYRELSENLRAHCQREGGQVRENMPIRDVLDRHPELVANGNHHIDISHLSAALRFAQVLDDPPTLRLAAELADYGSRLDPELCFPGEEPFVDLFASHVLFFNVLLNNDRTTSLEYFRDRAYSVDAHQLGTLAAEIYVVLLSRCGQVDEAIRQLVEWIPPGTHTTGTAPSLLELSETANDFSEYLRLARQQDDLLGFVAGLICRSGLESLD